MGAIHQLIVGGPARKNNNYYYYYCVSVHMCTRVAEREYDTSHFHNQVQRVLIDDHNVPKFT